jgi:competence protein ComEC
MKRPLLLFSISLILGILTAWISNSYFLVISVIILGTSIMTAFFSKIPKITVYILIGIVLFYSTGAFRYLYQYRQTSAKFKDFLELPLVVRGFIDSVPDIKENKVVYVVRVKEVEKDKRVTKIRGKVLLTMLKTEDSSIYDYGRGIEISGQLNSPKGRRNPGGFDYKHYLAQSGISATIFARHENVKAGDVKNTNFLVETGLVIRNRIVQVINNSLPEQQAGLLNGMIIGYREGLSEDIQEVFNHSGLTHIMAVSGANVAFIAAPLVFIFKRMRLSQKSSNIIIICVLLFFVFITGFEPSVMRAVIMAVVILTGQILRRETDIFTSIAFAAVLLLIYNPFTLFNIGFQLSFAATLSLVMFFKNIKSKISSRLIPGFISDVLAATLAAQVGVLPISASYFNKVSLVSVLSNLLVVPVLEVITILGALMAVAGQLHIVFSQVIGYVNCSLLSFVLLISKLTAGFPYAVVRIITPHIMMVIIYYILVLFLLWYKPKHKIKTRPLHYFIVIGFLIIIICISLLIPKELEIVFVDVGQGDSAIIRTTGGKTVLIDGGGYSMKPDSGPGIGDTVIIPLLLDLGISRLDLVVATHGHDDHIQGLVPVLKDFRVDNLVMPDNEDKDELREILNVCRNKKIKINYCTCGDYVNLDTKTFFKVLHPSNDFTTVKASLNNGSLVLKLFYGDTSVLFTGDIEEEAEKFLLENKIDVTADILKVAHHGSETSTSIEFLNHVMPKAAVISVGKNNFGHPSDLVVDRITKSGIKLFRTDLDGAVILKCNGRRIKFTKVIDD